MKLDIRNFFSPAMVAASLQRLPELKTPVMDFLFPPEVRINHPLPVVGYDDLGLPNGNVPVVRRGSSSINLRPVDGSIKLIEPQPVSMNTMLDAATINSLSQMTGQGVQQMMDNRINMLRQACRMTAEALCAQVITGKINYPMKADGALLAYQVDYGTPDAVTVTKKWDDNATKIADIVLSLGKIKSTMAKKGYGFDIAFLAGFDVYAALVEKVASITNPNVAMTTADGIQIGNIVIKLFEANYIDLASGNLVSGIPAKSVVAFDRRAGNKLFYASVDDLDADFAGMPFFTKAIKQDDPSGWKIIGTNKPLPSVNVKGILTASVLT